MSGDGVAGAGGSARRRSGVRREKTVFALLVAVGALLGFLSGSRPWVLADVSGLVAGARLVASGRQAAGVVPAVALVALAGGVAVLTTRQVGRAVAGVLLVLAGAAAAAASVGVLETPSSAVAAVVEAATGRAGETAVGVTVTAWPWAGVASGVLVALAGVVAVVRARAFGGLPARFDAPAQGPAGGSARPVVHPAPVDDEPDPGQAWDALSRGEDPTR